MEAAYSFLDIAHNTPEICFDFFIFISNTHLRESRFGSSREKYDNRNSAGMYLDSNDQTIAW